MIGVGRGLLLDLDHGKNHGETSLGLDGVLIVANRWLNPKVSIVEK